MREGMDGVATSGVAAWYLRRMGSGKIWLYGINGVLDGSGDWKNNIEQKIPTQTGVSATQTRAVVLMGAPGR